MVQTGVVLRGYAFFCVNINMHYGYNVFCSDGLWEYRFYAKDSVSEAEAIEEFNTAKLENGRTDLIIVRITEGSKFEWEHYDIHGDCFKSPNAKYGVPNRRKLNKKTMPKPINPYRVKL